MINKVAYFNEIRWIYKAFLVGDTIKWWKYSAYDEMFISFSMGINYAYLPITEHLTSIRGENEYRFVK